MSSSLFKYKTILYLLLLLTIILVWHSRSSFQHDQKEKDIVHIVQLDMAMDRKDLTKSPTEVEFEKTTGDDGPVTESIEKPSKNTPPMVPVTEKPSKNTPPTVDFVVRSAYIDTRARDGYKNCTVIFAEVSNDVRKFGLIVGCGVDTIDAKKYKVESLYNGWIWKNRAFLTHEEIMITCYDLEAHKDSMAFVAYHPAPKSTEISTNTVEITYSPKRNDSKNKTVACTRAFGKPLWLKEWLLYQKTIGVDLVQMYIDDTFMNVTENPTIIKGFVEEGFLRVDYRKTYFNETQINRYSQHLSNHDCLYRYQGVYEYALFFDLDDFFIPRLPKETSIVYYLNRFLPKSNQATVQFHWFSLFPECGLTQPKESSKDGNVTQLLKAKGYWDTKNVKFACRPHLTTHLLIHSIRARTKDAIGGPWADSNIAYVGHFRVGMYAAPGFPKRITCDTLHTITTKFN